MKTITLGEVLNEEQIQNVIDIIESTNDSLGRVKKLKAYFKAIGKQLADNGILPDYLAYVIESMLKINQDQDQKNTMWN